MLDPNFVLDDDGRERLITRFGAGVDAWCAVLPEMVELYCLRWHLELDKALGGNTSRVFIGRQHGNRGVVLKLTPDLTIASEEAIALRAWAATPHAVDLLDADLETGALMRSTNGSDSCASSSRIWTATGSGAGAGPPPQPSPSSGCATVLKTALHSSC